MTAIRDIWGGSLYLLLYPLILPFSFVIFPYWDRFGFRWQVLVVSALIACCSLLVDRRRSLLFCAWFSQSDFVWLTPLSLVWLLVMGVIHGFHGLNLQGLLSGLLVVLISPIYRFLLSKPLPVIVYRVLILLTCVVLMLESVFAFGYRYLGVGMNDDHLWSGDVLPRIFLNTRDGNLFAVFASCMAILLFWRYFKVGSFAERNVRIWLVSFFLFFLVFLNQVLTSGRGVVVSLLFSLLVLRFVGGLSSRLWLHTILICFCSYVAAYGVVCAFDALSGDNVLGAQVLIRSSSARMILWRAWLSSLFSSPQSFLFGHGFNHVPVDFLPVGTWPANPHNIIVQFISDCGVLGCSVVGYCIYRFRSVLCTLFVDADPGFLFAMISSGIYLLLSAALDWPTATWCLSLLPLALPAHSPPRLSLSFHQPDVSSLQLYPWQLFALVMCIAAIAIPFLTMKQYLPYPLHLRPFLGEDALFWFSS